MKPRFQTAFAPFIAIGMVPFATAATGIWSGPSDGTWDTTATNWTDVSGTPWDITNGPGNTATFNTASLAAVVSGAVDTNGITFNTTGAVSGGTINLAGSTPTIAVSTGQTGTISSILTGTAGLVKSDTGLLTLSGVNTYTGGTTVSGGRLQLVNNKTGSANFVTNAELEFNLTSGNQVINGGIISGTGNLIKSGGSTLNLGASGSGLTVALTGANSIIDVQGGTLKNDFGNSNWGTNKAGLNVATSAVFDTWDGNTTVDELNGSGTIRKGFAGANSQINTLTFGVNDGSGTFSGTIANTAGNLALVKRGTGTQVLSGANTYAGTTTVSAGILSLGHSLAMQNSTLDALNSIAGDATNGLRTTVTSLTLGGLTGSKDLASVFSTNSGGYNTLTALTLNLGTGLNRNYSGVIAEGATGMTLTKTGLGAISLSGANTYTGATTVSAGALGLRKSSTASVTVAAGAGLALGVGAGATYFTSADVDSLWANSLSGVSLDPTSLVGIDTSAGDFTYATAPSSTRGFVKLGSNTLTFTGDNASTYTGGTTVYAGVLSFANTAAKPTTGTVTVGAGAGLALAVGGAGFHTTADVDSLWANTLLGVSMNATSLVGIDTTQGGLTYTTPTTPLTRGLSKVGINTLTLTGANAYTGGTTVGAGRLILVNTKTGSSNFITNGDLEFKVGGGNLRINGGTISGTGNLIKTGANTLDLGNNGSPQTIALTGAGSIIDVQAGILKNDWGNSAWTSNRAGLTVATGATFDVWDGNATVDELNGTGTVKKGIGSTSTLTIGVNDGTGTFSGALTNTAGALALVKLGFGTQTLTGTITYGGGTTVSAGRLQLVNTKTGSSNFITNAELEFNITTGNQTLSGGSLSGTGNLIKTGAGEMWLGSFGPTAQTVALTGANSIVDVQGGLLRNEYGNSAWGGNKAGLTVASGATFDLWDGNATVDELNGSGTINKGNLTNPNSTLTLGANDGSGTFSGAITDTTGVLALVKQGTGTQTLAGVNDYTGATTVNGGKLVIDGNISTSTLTTVNSGGTLGGTGTVGVANVAAGGTLAPGNSIGTLNFSDTLGLAGISNFEIDPTLGLGLNADLANVANGINYGGILNVLYAGASSNFASGMIFNLFDASSFSGSFSTINLPSLTGGLTWQDNLAMDGTMSVVPEPNAAGLIGGFGMLALLRRRRA